MNNAVTSLEYRYKIVGSLKRQVYTGKCTLTVKATTAHIYKKINSNTSKINRQGDNTFNYKLMYALFYFQAILQLICKYHDRFSFLFKSVFKSIHNLEH